MELPEAEFSILHSFPVLPVSRILLRGGKTWRNLNHYAAPSALAPLARVRAPCWRSVGFATENLADAYSRRPGRFCCL
jgi:hypothetical protein